MMGTPNRDLRAHGLVADEVEAVSSVVAIEAAMAIWLASCLWWRTDYMVHGRKPKATNRVLGTFVNCKK